MEDLLLDLLRNKKFKELKEELKQINEEDLAEYLGDYKVGELATIFRLIPKDKAADVFAELDVSVSSELLEVLSEKEAVHLLDEMDPDDATDILEEMPANVVDKLLKQCTAETRKDINKLLNYKEDSAGSLMTVEYVDFKEDITVKEAINKLKKVYEEYETINTCYVVNNKKVLTGIIELKDLLFANNNKKLKTICERDVTYVETSTDQEEVANSFLKYNLSIMPVVDSEKRLVGIITSDDVMDVMEEEATEDIEKMAAIVPTEKSYLKLNLWEIYKSRMPWLLFLMISATFTGSIISNYEDQLAAYVVLTAFIPMLMDTGGNAGGQSSVTIIRALSLKEVEFKDTFKVLLKETLIGVICGLTLAGCNFVKLMVIDGTSLMVATVVCLSLFFTVLIAKLIGSLLPILANKIHLDPAVMASPLITTIVDAGALMIYFKMATTILGI